MVIYVNRICVFCFSSCCCCTVRCCVLRCCAVRCGACFWIAEGEAFVKAAEAGEVAPAALKAFFQAYMNAPKERVEDCVQRFTKRLAGDGEYKEVDPDVTATCARLSKEFPGDIGVFGPLLFNVVTLQPGQAMFLAANEPHAYLDGMAPACQCLMS